MYTLPCNQRLALLDPPNEPETGVLLICIRESNRVVFIAATRVAYLAETVIKSHYFVGLESGKLIA